jgi:hypothetical protein
MKRRHVLTPALELEGGSPPRPERIDVSAPRIGGSQSFPVVPSTGKLSFALSISHGGGLLCPGHRFLRVLGFAFCVVSQSEVVIRASYVSSPRFNLAEASSPPLRRRRCSPAMFQLGALSNSPRTSAGSWRQKSHEPTSCQEQVMLWRGTGVISLLEMPPSIPHSSHSSHLTSGFDRPAAPGFAFMSMSWSSTSWGRRGSSLGEREGGTALMGSLSPPGHTGRGLPPPIQISARSVSMVSKEPQD